MHSQVFVLSPANCSGKRAALLLNERAEFFLARTLRNEGAHLGEVFCFLSGLYFRGKLTYARAFTAADSKIGKIGVITAGRGLLDPDTTITRDDLRAFATVPIDLGDPRYRMPLTRDSAALAEQVESNGRVVLLGSIASDKYVEILLEAFGERLVFPKAFVGRGDLSRGSLLLRAVDEGQELEYVRVSGAVRRAHFH